MTLLRGDRQVLGSQPAPGHLHNLSADPLFPQRLLIVPLVTNSLRQFCTVHRLASKQSQESGLPTVATRRYRFLSGCHDDKAQGFESSIGCSWVNPEGNHALHRLTWSCIVRYDMATNRADRWIQGHTDIQRDLDTETSVNILRDLDTETDWYTERFRYKDKC